jgi:hypothetical protein
MWNDLSAAIVAMIKTSNEVKSSFVYDYAKSQMEGYPTITVTPYENQETFFADTQRNQRSYNFAIRVYQERLDQDEEQSERIMRTLVDDLISIFDADIYLNTTLQGRGFARPIPSVWQFIQGENSNTRMAEIILSCVVIQ